MPLISISANYVVAGLGRFQRARLPPYATAEIHHPSRRCGGDRFPSEPEGGRLYRIAGQAINMTDCRRRRLIWSMDRLKSLSHSPMVAAKAATPRGILQDCPRRIRPLTRPRRCALTQPALTKIQPQRLDALVVPADPTIPTVYRRRSEFALGNRLPTMFGHKRAVETGGFMGTRRTRLRCTNGHCFLEGKSSTFNSQNQQLGASMV